MSCQSTSKSLSIDTEALVLILHTGADMVMTHDQTELKKSEQHVVVGPQHDECFLAIPVIYCTETQNKK